MYDIPDKLVVTARDVHLMLQIVTSSFKVTPFGNIL